jgi:hypothetical protein
MIKSRRARWARHVVRRHAWSVLVRTPQRKRSLERDRVRWDDNIEIDHQEVGWMERNGLIWLGIGPHGRQK